MEIWEYIDRTYTHKLIRSTEDGIEEHTYSEWKDKDVNPPNPHLNEIPWHMPTKRINTDPRNIEDEIENYLKKHIVFSNDMYYKILTGWIMATWFKERWNYYPYLYFLGPRGSGKTRALELLQRTGRRARLVSSLTGPTLFRTIHHYDMTYLIDEARILKDPNREEVRDVILSGWQKDAMVPRLVGDYNTPKFFKCGGFKAFGSTITPFSPQLDDRCIVINMSKATPEKKRIDKETGQKIRNMLLEQRVNRKPVQNNLWDLNKAEVNSEDPRIEDLLIPIKTVLQKEENRKAVDKLVETIEERREEEKMTEEDADLAERLIEIYNEGHDKVHYSSMVKDDENPNKMGSKIGWFVKRHGLSKNRDSKGTFVDCSKSIDALKRLADRYNLELNRQIRIG